MKDLINWHELSRTIFCLTAKTRLLNINLSLEINQAYFFCLHP